MGKVVVLTKRQNKFSDYYIIEEKDLIISDLGNGDIVIYPKEIKRVCDVTTRTFELHDPAIRSLSGLCGFQRSDTDDSDDEEF